MATVTIYLSGDQVGTYAGLSAQGGGDGSRVRLTGAEPLGTVNDWFRVVIENVAPGETSFHAGQKVSVYPWPGTPGDDPLFSDMNPNHAAHSGRFSSGVHQVFSGPNRVFFDVDGFTSGTVQYGPGSQPPRDEQLPFSIFRTDPPVIPCFAAGTAIDTATGAVAVEHIRPGDMVATLDHGLQPVRWVGKRRVAGRGPFAPVVIAAGALGNRRKLVVSPQHRILMSGWRAALHFGASGVLVAARHLVNGTTIRRAELSRVTYVHMAFDRHEIVFSEGIASESLLCAPGALAGLDAEARRELTHLFPELADHRSVPVPTARRCLRSWEAAVVSS